MSIGKLHPPGRLIAIEGIDGVGKSTLATELCNHLKENLGDFSGVHQSFEPRRVSYGAELRSRIVNPEYILNPYEELSLFILDRKEHVEEDIVPRLFLGQIVVLDRYYYSSMAYQGALGIDPKGIESMHKVFAPEPDLLVILDLNVDAALERVKVSRGSETDAYEQRDFLEKVKQIFDEVGHPNLLRLDATLPTSEMISRVANEIAKFSHVTA